MSTQPPHFSPQQEFPASGDISVNTAAELREYLEKMGFSADQQPNLFQQIDAMQNLQAHPPRQTSSSPPPLQQSTHQQSTQQFTNPPQANPQSHPPQPPLLSQPSPFAQQSNQPQHLHQQSPQPAQSHCNSAHPSPSSQSPQPPSSPSSLPLHSQSLPQPDQSGQTQPPSEQSPAQPQHQQQTASGINPNLIRLPVVDHVVTFLQTTFANTNFLPESKSIDLVKILLFLEEKRCYSAEIAEAFARTFPDHFISPLLVRAAKKGYVLSQYAYCYLLILARRNHKDGKLHKDGPNSFLAGDDPMHPDGEDGTIGPLPINTPITQQELDVLESELNALHSSTDIVYLSNIKREEEQKQSKMRMAGIAALCSLAFVATTRFFLNSGDLANDNKDGNADNVLPGDQMKQLALPQQLIRKMDNYQHQQSLSSKQLSTLTQNVDVVQAALDIIKHNSTAQNSQLGKVLTEVTAIQSQAATNDDKTSENAEALRDIQAQLIVMSNEIKTVKKTRSEDDQDASDTDNDINTDDSALDAMNIHHDESDEEPASLLSAHNYHFNNPFFNTKLLTDDQIELRGDGTGKISKKQHKKKRGGKQATVEQLQGEITSLKQMVVAKQEEMEDVLFKNFIRLQNTIQDLQGVMLSFMKGNMAQQSQLASSYGSPGDDATETTSSRTGQARIINYTVVDETTDDEDSNSNSSADIAPYSSSQPKITAAFKGSTSKTDPHHTTPQMNEALQDAFSVLNLASAEKDKKQEEASQIPITNASDPTAASASAAATTAAATTTTTTDSNPTTPTQTETPITIPILDKLLISTSTSSQLPSTTNTTTTTQLPQNVADALSLADQLSSTISSLSNPQPKSPNQQPHPLRSAFCLNCLDRSTWESDFSDTIAPLKEEIDQFIAGTYPTAAGTGTGKPQQTETIRLLKMIRMYLLNISKDPSNLTKRRISTSNPTIKSVQQKAKLKDVMESIGFTFQWQWCQLDLQCICGNEDNQQSGDGADATKCQCKCNENRENDCELWAKTDQPQGTVCICGTLHRVQFALAQINSLLTGL